MLSLMNFWYAGVAMEIHQMVYFPAGGRCEWVTATAVVPLVHHLILAEATHPNWLFSAVGGHDAVPVQAHYFGVQNSSAGHNITYLSPHNKLS